MRGIITFLLLAAALVAGLGAALRWARAHPEQLPWTPLALTQPIGPFTGRKLAGLAGESSLCLALLEAAGTPYRLLPPRQAGACGYADGVMATAAAAKAMPLQPGSPAMRCPVAAALTLWHQRIVQPAAAQYLGSAVVAVDHYGTYACRTIAGGERPSEHGGANAIDIAGFRLADGRRITVAAGWGGTGAEAGFLHAVRDGACRLFATTLSPDYNAAHADHLHLDMAARGGSFCR